YTLQSVKWFFDMGCPMVILACNTASAKALRTIQQNDLPKINTSNRVMDVIRPTIKIIDDITRSRAVGNLATTGTVQSRSYEIEIKKFFPRLKVVQEACPMWASLVENNEHQDPGADYFIKKHLDNIFENGKYIDTLLLACTHYPLLLNKIIDY